MSDSLCRLTREEAASFLKCGMTKLYQLEKSGQLDGTFYNIGRRRLFIKAKLEQWILNGGEKSTFIRCCQQ